MPDYKQGEMPTSIHTRVNDTTRISSMWREYGNENFQSRAWETFLWEGDRIKEEFDTLRNADNVVDLHLEILNRYKNGGTPDASNNNV
jgi:hypothetical protein